MGFRDKYNFPLSTKWDVTQIDFVNPTDNPVTVDIFNPITLTNFPTSPSGTSYPSAVSSPIAIGAGLSRHSAISPVNQFIYVASLTAATVFVFDSVTNTFVTAIGIPTSITGQMVYCSSTNRIYGGTTGGLHIIDCASNTFFGTAVIPLPSPVVGLDYSAAYNAIFCTQPSTDFVYKVSCATNLVTASFSSGAGEDPSAIKYNPINDFVYALPTGVSSNVLELSPSTLAANATIPIASSANSFGTSAFVSSNNSIYYQEDVTLAIKQFDCGSLSINPTSVPFASPTISLIYVSPSNLLYASDNFTATDFIRVIDPTTNTLFTSIATPAADFGDFGSLVYNSAKNSVYETASPIAGAVRTFEVSATANFYVSSPYNYNALLQDVQQNPMLIRRLTMICESQSQFTQPFNIVTRDANGISVTIPRLPNIKLSTSQAQPNLVTIDFEGKELILDDNTMFSQYTFPAQTVTRIVVYYKQVKRIDIITKGVSLLEEVEKSMWLKQTSVTESELEEMSNYPAIAEKESLRQNRLAGKIKYMDKLKTLLVK